jgi:hypothetical protein
MKWIPITALIFFVAYGTIRAQEPNMIRWNFSSTKINDTTYELHMLAKVDAPWHIYSQNLSAATGFATRITFTKSPLVVLRGNLKEQGKRLTQKDPTTGNVLSYYSDIVEFVQTVTLNAPAKTRVNGSIQYMLCTDERCLPPATKKFTVMVGN